MRSAVHSFAAWSKVPGWILALFYPDVCQICRWGKATADEGYVCSDCWSKKEGVQFVVAPFCDRCGLPFSGEITVQFQCSNCRNEHLHFRRARAAVRLSGLVQDVIHRYKYNQATWFEPFLADLLVRQAVPILSGEEWDYIVPIPLHWRKLRERSFNQSVRLARALSRATNIPVASRLLRRVEPTETQTRLSRAQRSENVKRAFAFVGRKPLEGQRVIVLDDVLTTGATANACSKLLKQNGASTVDVWTVARGVLQ